jgi:hypothetical protein
MINNSLKIRTLSTKWGKISRIWDCFRLATTISTQIKNIEANELWQAIFNSRCSGLLQIFAAH